MQNYELNTKKGLLGLKHEGTDPNPFKKNAIHDRQKYFNHHFHSSPPPRPQTVNSGRYLS